MYTNMMAVTDVEVVELLTGSQALQSLISDVITGFTKQDPTTSSILLNNIKSIFVEVFCTLGLGNFLLQ